MIGRPIWDGQTVVCIASGPSLTAEDCELVRASGHPVVVTNTTFQLCPWADALFAYDLKWWKHYHEEVEATFHGRKFTASLVAGNYGAEVLVGVPWFKVFRNSGASAVSLAIGAGAAKVVMLGFDAGLNSDGKTHWHGNHPEGLGNASSISDWERFFRMLADYAGQRVVSILNASRTSNLTHFERVTLEDAL